MNKYQRFSSVELIDYLCYKAPSLMQYRDILIKHNFDYDKFKEVDNVYLKDIGIVIIGCRLRLLGFKKKLN